MFPERKTFTSHDVKAADGTVTAMFSVYGNIDHDGDVVTPGAFTDGQEVVISAYNHSSWGPNLPVGKGVIRTGSSGGALVEATFFKSQAAQDTLEVIRELGPLQQWSFGFNILDYSHGDQNGTAVRFLKSLDVFEVSPVLRGSNSAAHTVETSSIAAIRARVLAEEAHRTYASFVLRQIAEANREVA
ncbi:HK97 family phage prohead protease [Streptomyces sp. NPDC018964]|uniref:HK97 family phage prohead protease n=1 Tax=Streptomyces sp. NPDC018964 TaxID=3365058 RepID=UPI0037B25301